MLDFKRIKTYRLSKGMTQEELAKASGVSRLAISNLERGKVSSAKSTTLYAIAEALGVMIDDFFYKQDA